ncbi:MAG: hypothetical protein R3F59_36375 [Myxococcota bacterium]
MTEEAFKAALEAHRKKHENPWSFDAQSDLQALHLDRAAALEAGGDAEAVPHLRAAEDCQWVMGTESTSAGEGLESMGKLYEIRARRARMHERLGEPGVALDLWESIAADPNGLGKFAAPEVARLKG